MDPSRPSRLGEPFFFAQHDGDSSLLGFDDSESATSSPLISTDTRPLTDEDDSDEDGSFYQSFYEESSSHDQWQMDVDTLPVLRDELDLACSISGMYRILDLFSEQSSAGGLVDKIIISQESLEAFINSICPGAYSSITKVNFKALDNLVIKPIGVYGSKEEIVRFLLELRVIDNTIAAQLLVDPDSQTRAQPTLRSGLYIVSQEQTVSHRICVLYWPEETTWDDSASSSVRRNRITFMRYLTKMCDQVVSLISSKHAQTFVWSEGDEEAEDHDDMFDIDQDEPHRIAAFEVAETNQQEESVTVREGFKAISRAIILPKPPIDDPDPENPISNTPFLLFGETTQGFVSIGYQEPRVMTELFRQRAIAPLLLETYLMSDHLCLSKKLDDKDLRVLIRFGLGKRFPQRCKEWNDESTAIQNTSYTSANMEINGALTKLATELPMLESMLFEVILDEITRLYPCFNRDAFAYPENGERWSGQKPELLSKLQTLYPKVNGVAQQLNKDFQNIFDRDFRSAKDRICVFKGVLHSLKQNNLGLDRQACLELLGAVLEGEAEAKGATGFGEQFRKWLSGLWGDSSKVENLVRSVTQAAKQIPDTQFLSEVQRDKEVFTKRFPRFNDLASQATRKAFEYLQDSVSRGLRKLLQAVQRTQEDECRERIKYEHNRRAEDERDKLRVDLIKDLNDLSAETTTPHTLYVDNAAEVPQKYGPALYRISGKRLSQQDPMTIYTVHLMDLTTQDQHELQMNPKAIPSPRFKFSHKFTLPLDHSVIRAQLLQGEKLLLVIADCEGNLSVYLERLATVDDAIARGRAKRLNREKIGQHFLLTYDESKKMLAVVSSDKLLLYTLVFDDIRGFQALGSANNLHAWYPEGVSIRHACFVTGSEELLLVDSDAQARVFSLVTLQFRPATLQLDQVPYSVSSTPEGACLLVAQARESGLPVTAYHWSTFGSTEGILLDLGPTAVENGLVVTSLMSRNAVHVVTLDFEAQAYKSHALDITCKTTDFTFQQTGSGRSGRHGAQGGSTTVHNCLIDCFSEVWTRFPVLPAVQRETISSSSLRSARMLVFVTDRDQTRYARHFVQMIRKFERETKKPTGDRLKSIRISTAAFSVLVGEMCVGARPQGGLWNISAYRAGEWLVDFLCLIPIHLAVAKENRFVPLKDGVYSPELEKSLLGADVNRIVDNLSFGWYESLFQSYMASKPVRVVSSMGEQSVGKSFALNHLVDTSFAGSAMRTTEGVWMSVTPTKDGLIVALDFEGVHSIERSAQEDMLLVLFNTAISNLVLFRNNFALSRDITGLFQSFQSSSTVLDPKANPSLFQSTLVIIIKDVVESDQAEITKEFSLKFQRIVQDEREANFISRLHAGKLNIVPWPVIESRDFYRLFPAMKRRLDQQPITHQSAGAFLHLMKTLMAKLKANDWGAMSQTMASHRAQLLSMLLANALAYGYAEVNPEEPLKNLDTDLPIELPDTPYPLFIGGGDDESASRERILTGLQTAWEGHASRQTISEDEWVTGLTQHLEKIVDLRITHVNEWLDQNLARFRAAAHGGNLACIDDLKRLFESSTVELKGSVQMCGQTCAECHLRCVQSRMHEGAHDCQSNHECVHECDFCLALEPGEHRPCTMRAGHAGKHVCVPNQHLCSKPCKLYGRRGCLDVCAMMVDHPDEEHLCAAPVHACGQPCDLSDVPLVGGSVYSCSGTCAISSDTDHPVHQCDARFCSIQCQLCKRLCANQDHMHGLDSSAIHLCGEEHLCTASCAAKGICEIETAPQSIQATFTGRNETFQYTKYSQVAKRLKCIKPILPGATEHIGPHNHTLDQSVVHFCEEKCDNCGYFCTLPLGHPQQEHETRHGSMSRTRWTIDGPDDVPLEIEGRKFSANDEGGPMLCNLVCSAMGRHIHIGYCRADTEAECVGNEVQHLTEKLQPDPDRPKDVITHALFWKRSGFKDPYSKDEQKNFAKCDAMCGGPEHTAASGGAAIPSYCVLPLFHAPLDPQTAPAGVGYVSQDGHQFECKNPVVMQQAFHVIFVVDRSGSMNWGDRQPLPNTPATARITAVANTRYGAVLSSLHNFWTARATAIASSSAVRRDAYSIILFDDVTHTPVTNDFASTPDQLLDVLFRFIPVWGAGNEYELAIKETQRVMEQNWSTERYPIIIFLSDGEATIKDYVMHDLCRAAVRLQKAVSFHAVSFGPNIPPTTLCRMVDIALDAQNKASADPLAPAAATVLSSFTQAIDTIQLAETFMGIAESLRKPRGALMH